MKRVFAYFPMALVLAVSMGAAGCASTKTVDQLRADVQQATDRAASAEAKAEQSRSVADAAMKEASAARAAAERAEKAAADAKAMAAATDEKIDRMFKKTMHK